MKMNTFNARYSANHVLKAGDIISQGLKRYKIGSVASSAIESDNCPMREIERAKGFGHELHFVFGLGASISNPPRKPDYGTQIRFGETVYFEGRLFTFAKAANDNIKLIETPLEEPKL